MSEEIIIDDVNVAECEFYFEDNGVIAPDGTPERANICTSPENSCKNNDSCYCNKNCYYKQLKRLQAENYKLKESLKVFNRPDVKKVLTLYNCREIERLEQENKELKELKCKFKEYCTCDTERLQAENEELKAGLCKQCDFQKQYFSETKKLLAENEALKQRLSNCEEFSNELSELLLNNIKTLQAENERLNSACLQLQSSELKQNLEKVNCERKNYELRKENEELKKRQITKNGFICDCEQNVKYRQALEEIRNLAELEVILDKNSKAFYPANIQRTLDVINEVLK